MFTGIVEEVGTVERLETRAAGLRLRCREVRADLKPGASIAVNGVCLTAVEIGPEVFVAASRRSAWRRTVTGIFNFLSFSF